MAVRFATSPTHVCPIRGCTNFVPFTKLLCAKHWKMVPGQLGDELYGAWREVRRYPRMNIKPSPSEKAAAVIRHRKAMRACVDAVHAQMFRPPPPA